MSNGEAESWMLCCSVCCLLQLPAGSLDAKNVVLGVEGGSRYFSDAGIEEAPPLQLPLNDVLSVINNRSHSLLLSSATALISIQPVQIWAYIGGRKIDPLENVELTSSSTASFLVEGIAQNTTVGIFEPESG
ncbi:uncharacterized protein [Elaeis guineensis]|uniref:uncharacterized protein n=1 Tax=Elaeis guineensis var. tenera TaxID=51953 RepID=UPI003C6D87C9